jgi:DNA-binding CsgD family transcriptional regulator
MNKCLKGCESEANKPHQQQSIRLIQCAEDVDLTSQKRFCKEVNALCQPIFQSFNVNFFSHTRAFHNGQFRGIMTNPELTECFLKRKYPINFSKGKGFYLNSGVYITDCFTKNSDIEEKVKAFWNEFNIGYLVHIVKKNIDYDDMYSFGLNIGDKILVNKFLNHMKMINHFIMYFESQSFNIFSKITPVTYSKDYFSPSQNEYDTAYITDKEQELFFKSLPLKKVRISGNLGDTFLSQREYECLCYATKSYSLKEIAKRMNLSPRTIETYLDSVKNKLGVEKRSDLVIFNPHPI